MSQAALPALPLDAPAVAAVSGRRPHADADREMPLLNEMTRMQTARGVFRLTIFVLSILLVLPFQYVLMRLNFGAKIIPFRFHRWLLRVFGIRVKVSGAIEPGGGVLIAANHSSWIDILTVSSIGPISFIAKSEVNTWPGFGLLARLQQTIYVARDRRSKTAEQRDEIKERLAGGDTIVLFPEGTSSDGNRVLTFKSALMSAAEGTIPDGKGGERPIRVQPVSIAYTRLYGLPMNRAYRPFYAWYGDMDLVPHLWDMARLGPFNCEITIHPSMTVADVGSRKALAAKCEALVSESLVRSLTGRG
jgi:1-acyl-sn-glycerol-3-phosphate acyltransferase